MKKRAAWALVTVLVLILLGIAVRHGTPSPEVRPAAPPAVTFSAAAATKVHPAFLYGRITAVDGATYEGRLRWGGDQEAFWGDYFNGTKDGNPWAVHAPAERTPNARNAIEIFGFSIGGQGHRKNFSRPFMTRFGDIARIEAHFGDVQVTLKSGTVIQLDRFAAGDIDDGVRVWDGSRGVIDLDARQIRSIDLLPAQPLAAALDRLHGTVRTAHGSFTGFIQWDRQDCLGTDALDGRAADGARSLRYDTIGSIARRSRDSAVVTLLDGREIVLSGSRDVGHGNRGIYVDDARYGRVLVSWDAFERVDFSPGAGAPAYNDFAPGRALTGRVTTRAGGHLAGRLVYDFDESETTDTLDAPSQGVDYSIPFALLSSILPGGGGRGAERAKVVLQDGEQLQLDRSGDLGDGNAGILIFVEGQERPEYVPWIDVEQVAVDRPASGDR